MTPWEKKEEDRLLEEALREYRMSGQDKGWDSLETVEILRKYWPMVGFRAGALAVRAYLESPKITETKETVPEIHPSDDDST